MGIRTYTVCIYNYIIDDYRFKILMWVTHWIDVEYYVYIILVVYSNPTDVYWKLRNVLSIIIIKYFKIIAVCFI